ncbi:MULTISPECIES: hypothetical protein, partial [Deefgea]|uniref:hypothetical protein n=1 Tax=Deefgea TaxID=400947 RepID=UPI001940F5C2
GADETISVSGSAIALDLSGNALTDIASLTLTGGNDTLTANANDLANSNIAAIEAGAGTDELIVTEDVTVTSTLTGFETLSLNS